jgi:hypothetical protein
VKIFDDRKRLVKFGRSVGLFFEALSGAYRYNNIKFSRGLYLCVPRQQITFVSLGGDATLKVEFSINDATKIFSLIKSACDMNEIQEAEIGGWTWKIDARPRSADSDHVVIQFRRALESSRDVVQRADVAAAIADFATTFGSS